MAKAYYKNGALVTDKAIEGLTNITSMNDDCIQYYGKPYMICETISLRAAETVAKALGLEWMGEIEDVRRA